MTWTYTGNPATNNLDQVRFLIGDTDPNDQQLADGEITWAMTTAAMPWYAAAACCDLLYAKYARQVQRRFGRAGFQAFYNEKLAQYQALAQTLRARGAAGGAVIYAGGITESGKETDADDPDMVQPFFSRERFSVAITPEGMVSDEEDDLELLPDVG